MFQPRLTLPEKGNRFYIEKAAGGLNPCIAKPSGSSLRFANCVFYAAGRFAEITGIWLPSTNAENFVNRAKAMGLTISQKPALGAIICWAKGKVEDGSDGAGHVGVVEIINASGSIVTSESGWGAKKEFWTTTRKNDGNWGQNSSYRFLGFILPPDVQCPYAFPNVTIRKGDNGDAVKWLQWQLVRAGVLEDTEIDGDFGNRTERALVYYQWKTNLEIDGVCGSQTKKALDA
jgi:surface antigen